MTIAKTAMDQMQRDRTFFMYVRSAVYEAMENQLGYVTEQDVLELCHDTATEAAMIVLKRAFDNDAEVSRLRIENEHYRKLALRGLELTPITTFVPK